MLGRYKDRRRQGLKAGRIRPSLLESQVQVVTRYSLAERAVRPFLDDAGVPATLASAEPRLGHYTCTMAGKVENDADVGCADQSKNVKVSYTSHD